MKVLYSAALLIFFFSCNAQNTGKMTDNDNFKIVLPAVTKEAEKFQFDNFDKEKGLSVYTDKDGTRREYQSQSYGYITRIMPANTYFMIIKKFDQNGMITEKGLVFFSGGFKKGIWYYFNNQGALQREEDHDKPFKFTFADLVKYLHKEKIPLTVGYFEFGYHTKIYNEIENGKTKWFVNWLKDSSRMPNIIEKITIDGQSGKVIEVKTVDYFNN